MKKKLLLALSLFFTATSLSSLTYITVCFVNQKNNDMFQAVDISSDGLDTVSYNLGNISPGESINQNLRINSLLDYKVSYKITFSKEDIDVTSLKYINLKVKINDVDTSISKSLNECFDEEFSIEGKLNSKQSDLVLLTYTLNDDVPSEIFNTSIDFSLLIDAWSYM